MKDIIGTYEQECNRCIEISRIAEKLVNLQVTPEELSMAMELARGKDIWTIDLNAKYPEVPIKGEWE